MKKSKLTKMWNERFVDRQHRKTNEWTEKLENIKLLFTLTFYLLAPVLELIFDRFNTTARSRHTPLTSCKQPALI